MTIRGRRTELVGVHLRPRVKQSLRTEALKAQETNGLPYPSMSAVASEIIEEALTAKGYDLTEAPDVHPTPLLDTLEERTQ